MWAYDLDIQAKMCPFVWAYGSNLIWNLHRACNNSRAYSTPSLAPGLPERRAQYYAAIKAVHPQLGLECDVPNYVRPCTKYGHSPRVRLADPWPSMVKEIV